MTARQAVNSRKRKARAQPTDVTRDARTVLKRARASVKGFGHAFTTVRNARGVTRGTPKDEEQDLLRAAVVFAGAGLDSVLKQLVVDALPRLLDIDENCRSRFEEYVRRQFRPGEGDDDGLAGVKLLARALCDESPRDHLMKEYSEYLTRASLQSVEELTRVIDALGLDAVKKGLDFKELRRIFRVRNEIAHEMDIDLQGDRRKRQRRQKKQMVNDAEELLAAGEVAIKAMEERLRA